MSQVVCLFQGPTDLQYYQLGIINILESRCRQSVDELYFTVSGGKHHIKVHVLVHHLQELVCYVHFQVLVELVQVQQVYGTSNLASSILVSRCRQ